MALQGGVVRVRGAAGGARRGPAGRGARAPPAAAVAGRARRAARGRAAVGGAAAAHAPRAGMYPRPTLTAPHV